MRAIRFGWVSDPDFRVSTGGHLTRARLGLGFIVSPGVPIHFVALVPSAIKVRGLPKTMFNVRLLQNTYHQGPQIENSLKNPESISAFRAELHAGRRNQFLELCFVALCLPNGSFQHAPLGVCQESTESEMKIRRTRCCELRTRCRPAGCSWKETKSG